MGGPSGVVPAFVLAHRTVPDDVGDRTYDTKRYITSIVTLFFECHVHEGSPLFSHYNNKADRGQHDGRRSVRLPSLLDNIPTASPRTNYSLAKPGSWVRVCSGSWVRYRVGLLLITWGQSCFSEAHIRLAGQEIWNLKVRHRSSRKLTIGPCP